MKIADDVLKRVHYLAFCVEVYKDARQLNGKQVYEVFDKYKFFDYIYDLYEILHVHGTKYLLEELDAYRLCQEKKNREH